MTLSQMVGGFLERMDQLNELLPGARPKLLAMAKDYDEAGPAMRDLILFLHSDGKCYLAPAGVKSLNSEQPLRYLIDRLPLRSAQAKDRLFATMAADLCEFQPHEQARLAVDRITKEHRTD